MKSANYLFLLGLGLTTLISCKEVNAPDPVYPVQMCIRDSPMGT